MNNANVTHRPEIRRRSKPNISYRYLSIHREQISINEILQRFFSRLLLQISASVYRGINDSSKNDESRTTNVKRIKFV